VVPSGAPRVSTRPDWRPAVRALNVLGFSRPLEAYGCGGPAFIVGDRVFAQVDERRICGITSRLAGRSSCGVILQGWPWAGRIRGRAWSDAWAVRRLIGCTNASRASIAGSGCSAGSYIALGDSWISARNAPQPARDTEARYEVRRALGSRPGRRETRLRAVDADVFSASAKSSRNSSLVEAELIATRSLLCPERRDTRLLRPTRAQASEAALTAWLSGFVGGLFGWQGLRFAS
jgi:hypothetical protein